MVEDPSKILLTEDGHPIGDLVIATDEASVPTLPNDVTVEENRRELLAENAKALTGNPDADAAVAELYPGYGDPDMRRRAMLMYVTEKKELDEIAKTVGVPGRTVSMWIFEGKWDELLRKEIAAYNARSVLELARIRAENRARITKAQLDQAEKIRNTAMDRIENDQGSLKSNTESWAAAAKIEHTLTGVSEAGTVASLDGDSDADKKKDSEGKRPLVMVFQGGLPPVRRSDI